MTTLRPTLKPKGDEARAGRPTDKEPVMTTPTKPIELQAMTATAPSRPPLDPVHQAVVDERKADYGVGRPSKKPTRDALIQLQKTRLQGLQPHVFARVERALLNDADLLHEMVVEKLLMRVAPVAFWEGLGKQEFKEDETKVAPHVTIIVNGGAGVQVVPAVAEAPAGDVVSEQ